MVVGRVTGVMSATGNNGVAWIKKRFDDITVADTSIKDALLQVTGGKSPSYYGLVFRKATAADTNVIINQAALDEFLEQRRQARLGDPFIIKDGHVYCTVCKKQFAQTSLHGFMSTRHLKTQTHKDNLKAL